jgi:Tfp pilus assembly pilus retraction ATPase PilT
MADSKQPIDSHVHLEVEPEINRYFKAAIKAQASDLHLKVGQPPKLRLNEGIRSTTAEPLTQEKIEKLVFEILSEKQKQFFLENGRITEQGSPAELQAKDNFYSRAVRQTENLQ